MLADDCSGTGDFKHASDLVKFIKNHHCSKFTIGVAGYPQMHPESPSKEMDLAYLKDKVRYPSVKWLITRSIRVVNARNS